MLATRALEQACPSGVEAGGHGGGRSIRKGPHCVEKRASKRAEDSEFACFVETQVCIIVYIVLCINSTYDIRSTLLAKLK